MKEAMKRKDAYNAEVYETLKSHGETEVGEFPFIYIYERNELPPAYPSHL